MTSAEFETRLVARAARAGLDIPPDVIASLEIFYRLLAHWNAIVNLTAFRLDTLTDPAIDRLFIEPLASARFLLELPGPVWFDVGSGGGSPAIPFALVRPDLKLTMVESRERKAAFLREALRTLKLQHVVANLRLEDLVPGHAAEVALVTARGVRPDRRFFEAAGALLCAGGKLALFASGSKEGAGQLSGFLPPQEHALTESARLVVRDVPRGT